MYSDSCECRVFRAMYSSGAFINENHPNHFSRRLNAWKSPKVEPLRFMTSYISHLTFYISHLTFDISPLTSYISYKMWFPVP